MLKRIIGAATVGLLAVGLMASPAFAVNYFHAEGYQNVTNTGAQAALGVYDPACDTGDHTLAEIMVRNSNNDTIEAGWRKVCGDVPRLFAFHWEAGVPQGYNNADFVDIAGGVNLGDSLAGAVNTNKAFSIFHDSTANVWFVTYNGTGIAYIADNKFSPSLTSANETKFFGEVASNNASPCTDMGKGVLAAAPAVGGVVSTAAYFNASGVVTASSLTLTATHPSQYATNSVTARTFTYGGPGFC